MMARVKLAVPEAKIFHTSLPVRITDINYGNHLGNDALVSIIHECRFQWLAGGGFTELDIVGAGLIMSDLAVEYKAESFYGDVLHIGIAVAEIKTISFELYYEITAMRGADKMLIANAKTGMVCFDYAARKPVSIPEKFAAFLSNADEARKV